LNINGIKELNRSFINALNYKSELTDETK